MGRFISNDIIIQISKVVGNRHQQGQMFLVSEKLFLSLVSYNINGEEGLRGDQKVPKTVGIIS